MNMQVTNINDYVTSKEVVRKTEMPQAKQHIHIPSSQNQTKQILEMTSELFQNTSYLISEHSYF